MKILARLPVNPHSGYGQDGIGILLALRQAGCDVYVDPMHVQAPLPADVAQLFTKRLEPPFDLYLHHTDPSQLGISDGARRNARIAVAWSMWEMSSLDNMAGRSKLRRNLKNYDLVVGYDAVSSGAFAPYVSTNTATVQGGFWPRHWPARPRDFTSGTFRFCMVGALGPRKDPFVAIDAFCELREEHPEIDIELSIKTVTPGLHSKLAETIPGLRIYYDVWPEDVLRDFYYAHHILLAPSRGEGKNMPALEMMSTGGTVMATNWGGHTQWLSSAYAYPLDYTLGPVDAATPGCLWAKADKEHLKTLMLAAYRDRDEVARRAQTAAELIPAMCSWPTVIDRLMDRVGQICGDTGERVLHRYRVAKSRAEQSRQVSLL